MNEILKMISTYGFPMVITVYLLVRLEPLIRGLQKSVDTLTLVVSLQKDINNDNTEKLKKIVKQQIDESKTQL